MIPCIIHKLSFVCFYIVGRIVFQLFSDICPKTSKNFLCLCTGEYLYSHVITPMSLFFTALNIFKLVCEHDMKLNKETSLFPLSEVQVTTVKHCITLLFLTIWKQLCCVMDFSSNSRDTGDLLVARVASNLHSNHFLVLNLLSSLLSSPYINNHDE